MAISPELRLVHSDDLDYIYPNQVVVEVLVNISRPFDSEDRNFMELLDKNGVQTSQTVGSENELEVFLGLLINPNRELKTNYRPDKILPIFDFLFHRGLFTQWSLQAALSKLRSPHDSDSDLLGDL